MADDKIKFLFYRRRDGSLLQRGDFGRRAQFPV